MKDKKSELTPRQTEFKQKQHSFFLLFVDILKAINEIKSFESKFDLIGGEKNKLKSTSDNPEALRLWRRISRAKSSINNKFNEIVKFSDDHNFFWINCNEKIYKSYLINIKTKLSPLSKIGMIDILVDEINYYRDTNKIGTGLLNTPLYVEHLEESDYKNYLKKENKLLIKSLVRKKIDVLKSEIEKEGYNVSLVDEQYVVSRPKVSDKEMADFNPESLINKKGLPKLNIQTRYHIFKKLELEKRIETLICKNQNGRNLILASILNISPDNAKHLANGTYKHLYSLDDEAKLFDWLKKEDIDIKSFEK